MITKKLSDISIRISSGLTPLRTNPEFWENGSIPWLKTEQLGEKYIYDANEYISVAAVTKTSIKIFPENTLSIAMYGEGKTRGNLSIIKKPMATNQACCNVEIDSSKADYEYVYYFLKTQYDELRNLSSGIRKNLNSNDIKNYPIRLPRTKDEQTKIASVLKSIDAKIELNNRINAELEAMAKTLYDYWFVQFDFPFDFVQGKPDANGKPYKTSGGKMVYNPTLKREIPEGWTDGTLEGLGQIVGGSTPTTTEADNFCKNGTPWITPNDLSDNQGKKFITRGATDVSEAGIKSASLKKYPKGTVLLSSRAPIGYMAIARNELTTNQGFKSFVPNKGYSSAFIYYTVNNSLKAITQYASGSTFKEVSASVLKTIKIALPPKNISEKYTAAVSDTFARQDVLEKENEKLAALRDWLLPMLMNGQISVK
ncbi:Type I restriction enzyme, S subunit [Nitrosomonas nitrosa]|uniref:Type I restriction enzyme, S subunit n=1 Tax=Nitrosomonas nitrosa TaxID=52442 RepID=A0A8H8YZF8_9PROT|nr:restriction endonuclease subunit S [Nitrosomonas nitrosa]CAE6496852.1 Type I restriction enzyme, S subunit [Nitrosomonas nitrosa]